MAVKHHFKIDEVVQLHCLDEQGKDSRIVQFIITEMSSKKISLEKDYVCCLVRLYLSKFKAEHIFRIKNKDAHQNGCHTAKLIIEINLVNVPNPPIYIEVIVPRVSKNQDNSLDYRRQ